MTITAIISKRDSLISEKNREEIIKLGFKIETILPQGVIVKADKKQLYELEKKGYRIKVIFDTGIINLGQYKHDISKKGLPKIPANLDLSELQEREWKQHIVQLAGPIQTEWIQKLQQSGVDVVERVSNYGLLLYCDKNLAEQVKKLSFITWLGVNKPAYRISNTLNGQKDIVKWVNVSVYPADEKDSVLNKIRSFNGLIENVEETKSMFGENYAHILTEISFKNVPDIANLPNVRWLEFQAPDMPEDERSCQITAGNLNSTNQPTLGYDNDVVNQLTGLGLSGEGLLIGICDNGIDNNDNNTMHQDLRGRMAFSTNGSDGYWKEASGTWHRVFHGTHVACIAVGRPAGNNSDADGFLLGQGMAPQAKFGNLPKGTSHAKQASKDILNHNGVVSNNSWGGRSGQGYTTGARKYDLIVRDPNDETSKLEKLAIIFSAGNSGSGAGTITNPKEAKNIIVVGNASGVNGIRGNSSRGPAKDGRILPTVVAPGTRIPSARSGIELTDDSTPPLLDGATARVGERFSATEPDYSSMSGTSMAAPHVSGLCTLIIEWWRNRTGGRTPSPALLKAFLIIGAVDIAGGTGVGGNIPNNSQGWGRVSLRNMVLQAPDSDRGPKLFVDQSHAFTENGQFFRIRVAPVDIKRPLRITLVWTDAAAEVGAVTALMNDLDLEVREVTTNNIFKGNEFRNGFSITGGDADHLNNIECVYIESPDGIYEITVFASNIQASAHPGMDGNWQDFALVTDNAETPLTNPVSVVPVLDRSGSMQSLGYVDNTRVSSQQFVDSLITDDKLGIVSFGSTAKKEFPGPGNLLEVVIGAETKNQANSQIRNINFSGYTYMGAGINLANDMLSSEGGSRAMVLLSDGYDNKGGEPGNVSRPSALDAVSNLPNGLPVFSCAMGPTSDQSVLQQIASISGGRYYYMPTIEDLFEIYNYIRGQVTGDSIVVNESNFASSSRVGGFVDELAEEATFTVSWADTSLKYVDKEPLKSSEISVQLRAPNGKLIHNNDSYIRKTIGNGYAVFRINAPSPGQWYVEVKTLRNKHTRYTVGGFVKSPVKLSLFNIPQRLIPGSPIRISLIVQENGKLISGYHAEATSLCPDYNISKLLRKYAESLGKIEPDKKAVDDGMPVNISKLILLRNGLLKKGEQDILGHKICGKIRLKPHQTSSPSAESGISPINAKPGTSTDAVFPKPFNAEPGLDLAYMQRLYEKKSMSGSFTPISGKGTYNILISVHGVTPETNIRFVRKEMVSVLVE